MQKFLTNAQMRSADLHTINELGVPSSELMERAGRAIADRAADALLKMIHGESIEKKDIIIPVALTKRESTSLTK